MPLAIRLKFYAGVFSNEFFCYIMNKVFHEVWPRWLGRWSGGPEAVSSSLITSIDCTNPNDCR